MIPSILKEIGSKKSIKFINSNYGAIGPFMGAHLDNLQKLRKTREGCIALAKIYFSLQMYDDAIKCLEGIKLENDGSFFYRRMMFRVVERYLPQQEMNEETLGYLFEKGKFEEIKRFKDFWMVQKLAKRERVFYNWLLDNYEHWDGNNMEALYLKIDALAKRKDLKALQEMVNAYRYPENLMISYYLFESYPFISRHLEGNDLLKGTFQKQVHINFLVQNNKTNFNFLNSLGRHNNKFDSRVLTLLSNAIMNMGTTNDSLYRLNTDLITNIKPWNRFMGTSLLGNIHMGNENPYEILQKYLPNEGDLKRGGSLLALGFINKLECKDEDIEFFSAFLTDTNLNGEIQHGAALGLGLVAMGSSNPSILKTLLKSLHSGPELVVREGLLISIGMINTAQGHESPILENSNHFEREKQVVPEDRTDGENKKLKKQDVHEESLEGLLGRCENMLLQVCRESEHERESRSAGIGFALTVIGTERQCLDLIEDKNEVVRYSGTIALGAAFAGTGNLDIISRILDMTNDGDDNVKRAAVFGLGLVCASDRSLLMNILKPLATNHSPSIRATIALTMGFFLCGTGDLEASRIIEALLYDGSSLVVQQAGLGLGFLLMQCNSHINPNFKRMVGKLNSLTTERAEDCSFKFGSVLGRALIEAGGTNIIISVLNSVNRVESSRVAGAILFFQYWFWYPLFPFIGLCMRPTAFFAFDKNLELARQEITINEKKSKFDYEFIKVEEPKKQRRFRRKEQSQVKEPVVVEEAERYTIKSGERMTIHEMSVCGKEDLGFVFLDK